jgi:ABC-type sulfate transport system permease component
MLRKIGLLIAAGCTYSVSWFAPAAHTVLGNISGRDAFAPALSSYSYTHALSYGKLVWLLSAWTNALFVTAFALVAVRYHVSNRALAWGLASAAFLNLLFWLPTELGNLRYGFYLWIFSFAVLAAAASLPRPNAGAGKSFRRNPQVGGRHEPRIR